MKEKIKNILKKKSFKIVIILIILLIIALLTMIIYNFTNKNSKNSLTENDNFPTNNNNNIDSDFKVTEAENNTDLLYRIYYVSSYDNKIYDILIDSEYNISLATLDEISLGTNMSEQPHENIDFLNSDQMKWLVNYLAKQDYTLDLEISFYAPSSNFYCIANYSDNKTLIYSTNYHLKLDLVIKSIIEQNALYYDYFMSDNSVTNYIQDQNYNVINLSYALKLYSKIKDISAIYYGEIGNDGAIYESYKYNELNSNTIITISLKNIEEDYNFSYCTDYDNVGAYSCYIDTSTFMEYVHDVFNDITIDISTYSGHIFSISGYYYDQNANALRIDYYSGGSADHMFNSDLVYAYETEDKIVLIEGLFYIFGSDPNDESISSNRGYMIYESTDRKLELSLGYFGYDEYNISKTKALSELQEFVTYYAHTFTLADDGNYYYTNITRLN